MAAGAVDREFVYIAFSLGPHSTPQPMILSAGERTRARAHARPSIFNDFQRISTFFNVFQCFLPFFNVFKRFSTILGRPAVSGSIGNKSTDSGRSAVQKSSFRGKKSLGVSANHFPSSQSKTLTKRSSREQGEKTSTTRSGCQCQF